MERLPGSDLGLVYGSLSTREKCELAECMADFQGRVARLPTWQMVLVQHLARSPRRMDAAGLVDPTIVDRVAARLSAHASQLDVVRPVCFPDVTTTKNVLVHRGQLCGMVDVDCVCYGDPLRSRIESRTGGIRSRKPA